MLDLARPSNAVFHVPFGRPFLNAVASAILAGDLPRTGGGAPSPLDLAGITVLVPSRRAARALRDAFLSLVPNGALLLPAIRPISDTDEDLSLVEAATDPLNSGMSEPIPNAIDELSRRMLLARLVGDWRSRLGSSERAAGLPVDGSPAHLLRLAAELGRLMDLLETEGVGLDRLQDLVPDDLAEHWKATLSFLQILAQDWPRALAARQLLSPMARRERLILAEAERIAAGRHQGPLIVAGVTGSIPATARLMRAVAAHPQGAIVLPGLDAELDEPSFAVVRPPRDAHAAAHPEHPQFDLAGLMAELGVRRSELGIVRGAVQGAVQGPGPSAPSSVRLRARILSETMRPASTTARWRDFAAETDAAAVRDALRDVSLVTTPTVQAEADVIAVIMREALETPGRTAALVSPDRLLARRVAVRLQSWGITIDDSAGRPLRKTPPGALVDLILEAVRTRFSPSAVTALVKHPLTTLGLLPGEVRKRARNLEVAAFRTVYLGRDLDGVDAALKRAREEAEAEERRERPVRLMKEADWEGAADLVHRLTSAFEPLERLRRQGGKHPLGIVVTALVETAEALCAGAPDAIEPSPVDVSNGGAGPETVSDDLTLWRGEAGETLSTLFTRLCDPALDAPDLRIEDMPDLYRTLVATETVRPRTPVHPRLSIWGPLEARLQSPDVVILASLNEGTWPDVPDAGPWLNRPMLARLGLPLPEAEIGRSAHDFISLCGCDTVVLTRSRKVDGTPTVPSRWLMRLEAVLKSVDALDALAPKKPWLAWARTLTEEPQRVAIGPPEPRPPLSLRPKSVSVTDVETWIANPYALFARKILTLDALPALGQSPDAALRGKIVHEAMSQFAAAHPTTLPDDIEAELMGCLHGVIERYTGHPRVAAFWTPRFRRFARWFAATERERRADLVATIAEAKGRMAVAGARSQLQLTARADRIDVTRRGIVIYDYKGASGIADLAKRAKDGLAPQLLLEAAVVAAGGFSDARLTESPLADLVYVSTSGSGEGGAQCSVKLDDVAAAADAAIADLARLCDLFADPQTPYRAVRRAKFTYDYDSYAQLARAAEWLSDATGEDGE